MEKQTRMSFNEPQFIIRVFSNHSALSRMCPNSLISGYSMQNEHLSHATRERNVCWMVFSRGVVGTNDLRAGMPVTKVPK